MKSISTTCLNCKTGFFVEPRQINRGWGKFCSKSCSSTYTAKLKFPKEPNENCAACGVKFYKPKGERKSSKSGLFFCCREHKNISARLEGIKEIHPPHYGTGVWDYRVQAFKIKEAKCERCHYNANRAAIVIHHKDRNRTNNSPDNLEVLCANCHAIEHYAVP